MIRPPVDAFRISPTCASAEWHPVRHVPRGVACSFCRYSIPPGSPGTRTGERGTRAYYCPRLRIYECLECRTEALRAESAGSG